MQIVIVMIEQKQEMQVVGGSDRAERGSAHTGDGNAQAGDDVRRCRVNDPSTILFQLTQADMLYVFRSAYV